MQWKTQAVKINNNIKFIVDFTLHALIVTNVVTWKCHVDDPATGRYYMILGTYLLTEL